MIRGARGLLVLIVAGRAGVAHADRREASLHAHAVAGLATTTDPAATRSASAPLGGLAVRAGYATHNNFQLDVAIAVLATGGAGFSGGTFQPTGRPPVSGPFAVTTQVVRLDGGVTTRLGVVWIPTLRLAGGFAGRHRGAPVVSSGGVEVSGVDATGRGGALQLDLVATATAGLDRRLGRRCIVGAAIGGSVALPLGGESFRTIEATFHAAYYWYPR